MFQNLKGAWAKGPTKKEFRDIIKKLVPKAEQIMAANAHLLDNPEESDPIYSFDGPSIHDPSNLTDVGVVEGQNTFPLPAYAGDIHKVIEHVHAQVTKSFAVFLQHVKSKQSHQVYRAQAEHCFWRVTSESVARDVESLPDTLSVISKPKSEGGTAGGWAPRPLN